MAGQIICLLVGFATLFLLDLCATRIKTQLKLAIYLLLHSVLSLLVVVFVVAALYVD